MDCDTSAKRCENITFPFEIHLTSVHILETIKLFFLIFFGELV